MEKLRGGFKLDLFMPIFLSAVAPPSPWWRVLSSCLVGSAGEDDGFALVAAKLRGLTSNFSLPEHDYMVLGMDDRMIACDSMIQQHIQTLELVGKVRSLKLLNLEY